MTALSKFEYSVHTTSVLLPTICAGIAWLIKLTDVDDWFVEHDKIKILMYVAFGVVVTIITSVINKQDVEKDIKGMALNFLFIPLIFVFVTIDSGLLLYQFLFFIIFGGGFNFAFPDMSRREYLFLSLVAIAFFVITSILAGYMDGIFEGFLCSYLLFMMLFTFQYNKDYISMLGDIPSYRWDDNIKKMLAAPIESGYNLAKNNFLSCFLLIGDFLGEADSNDK